MNRKFVFLLCLPVLTTARTMFNDLVYRYLHMSSNTIIVLTSVYLVLCLNFTLLSKVYSAITALPDYSIWFIVSVPVLFVSLFSILISIIAAGPLLKPVLITLIIMSSVMAYATASYGVLFDFAMVQNILETNSSEVFSYANFWVLAFFLVTGALPALIVMAVKVKHVSFLRAIAQRASLLVACASVIGITWVFFFANYAAVGRNNHELVQYITPFKFIKSVYRYADQTYFSSPHEFLMLDKKPFVASNKSNGKVTVLVLGETARAQNFSLNGYPKQTNPLTEAAELVSFEQITSCGTATAVSVPCMFSRLNHDQYDKAKANSQQNIVDIAQVAGIDVLWIDNNNGSCKGVCARVTTIEIEPSPTNPYCDNEYCVDEALLEPLSNKLHALSHKNTLIVLHMMGSHGPTYYRRYPADKRVFSPDCPRSDIQHCSEDSLLNTYDNTIAYTDFVLNEIVGQLQTLNQQSGRETSLLYVSDHGESLGEKGAYLHGLPFAFAPKEQTHVPMLFWNSEMSEKYDLPCLKRQSKKQASHDNLFDTLLGMNNIVSSTYQANNDLLAMCQKQNLNAYQHDIELNTEMMDFAK